MGFFSVILLTAATVKLAHIYNTVRVVQNTVRVVPEAYWCAMSTQAVVASRGRGPANGSSGLGSVSSEQMDSSTWGGRKGGARGEEAW
jgi:uncharacterized membrane protein YgcG